jgi:hypothetical protein
MTDPSRSHVLHRIPPRVFVWHGTKSPLCLHLNQATHVLTQVQCTLVQIRDIPGSMAVPIHPRSEIGRAFHVKICNYLQTTRILHVGINPSEHHTGIASISRVARLFNFKNDGNRPSTSNVALAVIKLIRYLGSFSTCDDYDCYSQQAAAAASQFASLPFVFNPFLFFKSASSLS